MRFWHPIVLAVAVVSLTLPVHDDMPSLPRWPPQPAPTYMRNNINNKFGVAPDKGTIDGPAVEPLPGSPEPVPVASASIASRAANEDQYWLSQLGPLGKSAFAPDGYQFFRNVKDFGAKGDGITDDTAAISRAASAFSASNLEKLRCGKDCGSTTTLSAVVYFPPGTYIIKRPIIQYFHTQFVGNPNANDRAVIKGAADFAGIALVDANPYIPGGNGRQWYINQSNFFRQIRNLVFDMTGMARYNQDGDQQYVPTGIHWQVGQATSIHNCHFKMSLESNGQAPTAIGIFMENGSGGSVSDLTFQGGNIGFFAGSQQFTATNLRFVQCLRAIKQEWNWGFVWKNLYVQSCYVAIDCTQYSENSPNPQGTGSITVLDSHFVGVPWAITVRQNENQRPSIVIENLLVENVADGIVFIDGVRAILPGSGPQKRIKSWVMGSQVQPGDKFEDGAPKRTGDPSPAFAVPPLLLDPSGNFFYRSKPQYENIPASAVIVATAANNNIRNDGTGDQTNAINNLLRSHVGSLIFFPGGTYLVQGTIFIPLGSKIVGSGWSAIMGTGSFFSDERNPKPLMRVGEPGDAGIVEISDMVFTTRGRTPGMVVMEWNVHQSQQGSAAMWDSHFRIGGGAGTELLLEDCPARTISIRENCMAASLLLHLTTKSSGFFDNVWVWVSDHDLESPLNGQAYTNDEGIPTNVNFEVTVYVGRGVLIESEKGPTWLWGCASEHSQLYQWTLNKAVNVFMGHVQTETPYYQPSPSALKPYTPGLWKTDPAFLGCNTEDNDSFAELLQEGDEGYDQFDAEELYNEKLDAEEEAGMCRMAWALRVLGSKNVVIYSAGFYSFFKANTLGCAPGESCQTALVDTFNSGMWLFNLFTKGASEMLSIGDDAAFGAQPLPVSTGLMNGYTTELAAWLVAGEHEPIVFGDEGYDYDAARLDALRSCIVFEHRADKPSGWDQKTLDECGAWCDSQLAVGGEERKNYGCVAWYEGFGDDVIPWYTLSDGKRVTKGKCFCNSPIVQDFGEVVIEGIIEAMKLIANWCYILMGTMKALLDIALDASGIGRLLSEAEQFVVDIIEFASYVYPPAEEPAAALDWWLFPCGGSETVSEDIKRTFDIIHGVTSADPGRVFQSTFKGSNKYKKGSGKKGDSGNPKEEDRGTRAPPRNNNNNQQCRINPANQIAKKGRVSVKSAHVYGLGAQCKGQTTHITQIIVTTLAFAPGAKEVTHHATCSEHWTQACHHYSSAIRVNPAWATLPCPTEAAVTSDRRTGKMTASWSASHKGAGWMDKAHREETLCDMDEYPPVYLLGPTHTAMVMGGRDSTGQLMRYLKAGENRGAGSMWGGICLQEPLKKKNGVKDSDFLVAARAAGARTIVSTHKVGKPTPTVYTRTEVTMTVTQSAVFTIKEWKHKVLTNDGLEANGCWPSKIAKSDPGFALLGLDPYYLTMSPKPTYDYRQPYVKGTNGD